MSTAVFEAQLFRLRAHYRIVPPSTLLDAIRRRRFGQRVPVALTFDDDLRSHVETTLPVLKRLGVQAGFFLCGASLTEPHSFWWEDLQRSVDDRRRELLEVLPPEGGDHLAAVLAGEQGALRSFGRAVENAAPAERARVASDLRRVAGGAGGAPLDAEGVRLLAAAGYEIGFHTLWHESLPTLDAAELAQALADGRAQLEQVVGRPLRMLAYPHGRAADREARAARDAGYACAFTGRPEALRADGNPFLLGRIEPSFDSVEVFEAQLGRALQAARA